MMDMEGAVVMPHRWQVLMGIGVTKMVSVVAILVIIPSSK